MESQAEHVPMTTDETAPLWTDEKHLQFLNSIEASFVTAMLENSSGSIPRIRRQSLDASEATSDPNPHRSTYVNHRVPGSVMGGRSRTKVRRRMRIRSSQACNSFEDQVVPRVGNGQHAAHDYDEGQASSVD